MKNPHQDLREFELLIQASPELRAFIQRSGWPNQPTWKVTEWLTSDPVLRARATEAAKNGTLRSFVTDKLIGTQTEADLLDWAMSRVDLDAIANQLRG